MKITETGFQGLLEIEPEAFEDSRGYLFESYNADKLKEHGIPEKFPLELQSKSKKGVLRGLHFQKEPFAQGKLVRVARGKIFDVVVDIRENSNTYGKWKGFELSEYNKKMLWVPAGFAHGFLSLEDDSIFCYKVSNPYSKEHEGGLSWNDPVLNIDWKLNQYGIKQLIVSERDKKHPPFERLRTMERLA